MNTCEATTVALELHSTFIASRAFQGFLRTLGNFYLDQERYSIMLLCFVRDVPCHILASEN